MGRADTAYLEGEQARRRFHGTEVGKYQLLAVLGRGGMAEVFLAFSRGAMGFDKLAVVKRMREWLAEDEGFRRMFIDEARLAARLNHQNVVHTYEVGEHEGTYYLAMEYLDGQPLNKVMRVAQKTGNSLSPPVCARIVSDALAGLHHAHTLTDFDGRPLGIIHRDISPHNLFMTYEGTIKVVDFGIAKAALSSSQTEVGVLKGKVSYMSPEQATGGSIDLRSDLFAMGIVLWEMLTEQRLMTGDNAAATIHRLLTVPIPPASAFRVDVGPTLDAILERALQKKPERRFSSALEMREALEGYLASVGGAPRGDEIGREMGTMFASVRETVKRQIQEHVEGADRDTEVMPGNNAVRRRDPLAGTQDLPMLNSASGMSSTDPETDSSSGIVASGSVVPMSLPLPLGLSIPVNVPNALPVKLPTQLALPAGVQAPMGAGHPFMMLALVVGLILATLIGSSLGQILLPAYLGLVAIAWKFQRRVIYQGQGKPDVPAPADGHLVTITSADVTPVNAMQFTATGGRTTVIMFHDDNTVMGNEAALARELVRRGLTVVLVEYRGYGLSQTGKPTEPAFYADAEAVLQVLAAHGVGPAQIALWGTGLGAGVAAEMAVRGYGSVLVLVSPATSMTELIAGRLWWLPVKYILEDRFETQKKLLKLAIPTLVVHGNADEIIPFQMGDSLSHSIPGARLLVIPGGQHADLFVGPGAQYLDQVAGFVRTFQPH